MKKVGIYSGSFNPIHIGHLALANYLREYESFDEIWFVVSPNNPWKEGEELLPDDFRLQLVEKSIAGYDYFKASDVEFHLPKPSYTVFTLEMLRKKYPDIKFCLIIGADNWVKFDHWKDSSQIIAHHDIYVYPRKGFAISESQELAENIHIVHSPILEISSTFIRQAMKEGHDIRFFVHPGAWNCLCHYYNELNINPNNKFEL